MSQSLHIVCPHCEAVNRVAEERLAQQPKCGKCHKLLFTAHPLELTAASFQKHLGRNDLPLVVDFWAPWCGPCKMMAPAFEQAAGQLEPRVRLAKVNTENEQSIAAQYAIRSIPTLMIFKNGQVVSTQPGAMGAADIVRWVQGNL
ncbi:MAG: thioredoxin TrxC [Gammaproteobacteria bacterium]